MRWRSLQSGVFEVSVKRIWIEFLMTSRIIPKQLLDYSHSISMHDRNLKLIIK